MKNRHTEHIFEMVLLAFALLMPLAVSAAQPGKAGRMENVPDASGLGAEQQVAMTRDKSTRAESPRPCPPFCVNPMNITDGVTTVAELEVIQFRQTAQWNGNGVLIDARSPQAYRTGTIPGSVNIPFSLFERTPGDPELVQTLRSLGAQQRHVVLSVTRVLETMGVIDDDNAGNDWDYSNASDLLLWCSGPRCEQSPRAIKALIALGYPAEKLYYYRGGMQMWQSLGLETVKPGEVSSYASK